MTTGEVGSSDRGVEGVGVTTGDEGADEAGGSKTGGGAGTTGDDDTTGEEVSEEDGNVKVGSDSPVSPGPAGSFRPVAGARVALTRTVSVTVDTATRV